MSLPVFFYNYSAKPSGSLSWEGDGGGGVAIRGAPSSPSDAPIPTRAAVAPVATWARRRIRLTPPKGVGGAPVRAGSPCVGEDGAVSLASFGGSAGVPVGTALVGGGMAGAAAHAAASGGRMGRRSGAGAGGGAGRTGAVGAGSGGGGGKAAWAEPAAASGWAARLENGKMEEPRGQSHNGPRNGRDLKNSLCAGVREGERARECVVR